jgi:esterase/lipase
VLRVEYGYRIAQNSYNKTDINKLISDSLSIINLCLEKGYKRVIFVSKSLGTVIAGEVAKIIGYNRITHIFLTPIEGAIPHMMESKGLVIIGTADNLFPTERVQLILSNTNLNIHLIKDGNHGIEVDDFEDSISMLTDVIRLSIDYIAKSD